MCTSVHRKRCSKFLRWGSKAERGCKELSCPKLHPVMCPASLDLLCTRTNCKYKLHVQRCRRKAKPAVNTGNANHDIPATRAGGKSGGKSGAKHSAKSGAKSGAKSKHSSPRLGLGREPAGKQADKRAETPLSGCPPKVGCDHTVDGPSESQTNGTHQSPDHQCGGGDKVSVCGDCSDRDDMTKIFYLHSRIVVNKPAFTIKYILRRYKYCFTVKI